MRENRLAMMRIAWLVLIIATLDGLCKSVAPRRVATLRSLHFMALLVAMLGFYFWMFLGKDSTNNTFTTSECRSAKQEESI